MRRMLLLFAMLVGMPALAGMGMGGGGWSGGLPSTIRPGTVITSTLQTATLTFTGNPAAGIAWLSGASVFYQSGVDGYTIIRGVQADSSTAIGTYINTTTAYSTAGSKLVVVANGGTTKFSIAYDGSTCVACTTASFPLDVTGNARFTGTLRIDTAGGVNVNSTTGSYSVNGSGVLIVSSGETRIRGNATNGATAFGVRVIQGSALSTDGAKPFAVYQDNASTEIWSLEKSGVMVMRTGADGACGTSSAMSTGTATVSTTAVEAGDRIFLTHAGSGTAATFGALSVGTITADTSFVINSASATDNDTVNWCITR